MSVATVQKKMLFTVLGCYCLALTILLVKTTKYSKRSKPEEITGTEINNYRNGYIWIFDESDGEKIFLYNKVLRGDHKFNHTRVLKFRKELISDVGQDFYSYISLDKQNSPIGSELTFNANSKESKFKITEDIYKRLPENTTYKLLPRCSVVGNSGSLLHSNCGGSIDKADFVYRCNAAPIPDFASDAGAKTHFTTFNPSIFITRYGGLSHPQNMSKFLQDARQYSGYLWIPCLSYRVHAKTCLRALRSYNNTENVLALGHPDHFLKVKQFWDSRGLKKRPSSGFYLTSVALSHCDEVHLYGFWPFSDILDSKKKPLPYHYFDNLSYDFKAKKLAHTMNVEFSLLVQLHLLGVIKIHVGECKSTE